MSSRQCGWVSGTKPWQPEDMGPIFSIAWLQVSHFLLLLPAWPLILSSRVRLRNTGAAGADISAPAALHKPQAFVLLAGWYRVHCNNWADAIKSALSAGSAVHIPLPGRGRFIPSLAAARVARAPAPRADVVAELSCSSKPSRPVTNSIN